MNWSNYNDVMRQLRGAGLLVDSLEVGRMTRCRVDGDREKRGWYSLHELRKASGDSVLVGSYGVWRGAESNATKVELNGTETTAEERAAMRARMAEDRRAADRQRRALAARAALRAQRAWELMARDGSAQYLARKGVQAHGVRYSPRGAVVLPVLDIGGRVHGLQFIHAEKRHGRDKDYWPPGMQKQGHFFLIGGPQSSAVLLVAEGYATAASLFEATGWPVAVAFDAGNLLPVAEALAKRYRNARILVCADDDYLTEGNPGVTHANAAAVAVGGAVEFPRFAADRAGKKITDFNDLAQLEGLQVVRSQIEARLRQLGWLEHAAARVDATQGIGDAGDSDGALRPVLSVDELLERFALVYEMPETVFDAAEHKLVPLSSMRNLCVTRQLHRGWMESDRKRIVRVEEVGFDPAGTDPRIRCNLWGGWPTTPKEGECEGLLELLHHLCSGEQDPDTVYRWIMCWLAYPIQYPGTKMRTALVVHGPQGSGKNMFFEAIASIYGPYARVIDQAAVEDKFNDWASRKLYLIADEVVARAELFHVKNRLKGLITGDTIRINPKNVGAYEERNHLNMVILSNEVMPAVLEGDDRRYLVVWTPPKLDPAFYERIKAEMSDGGVAALHEFLRKWPLGDFKPWTMPPVTRSKRELIDASMGSSERFIAEWITERTLPIPVGACRSEDLFDAYRFWCGRTGSRHPAINVFVAEVVKRGGITRARRRYCLDNVPPVRQSQVLFPPGADAEPDVHALGEAIGKFTRDLKAWKREVASDVD